MSKVYETKDETKELLQEIEFRPRVPRIRLSLPPRTNTLGLLLPNSPMPTDVEQAASKALADHIKQHDNYFPTDERTPAEWVAFMEDELGHEWQDYIARHRAHEEEMANLAQQVEDIRDSIARDNRIQCTRFMISVKEKTRAAQREKLIAERDKLQRLKETNERIWKDMMSNVEKASGKDIFPDIDDTMVAEMDEEGPLSATPLTC